MKKNNSIQEWIPFEKILENGIIKLKDNSYVKIIKILPINFNLKTDFEKEQILNSYKIFLKTCNFDIQILIQSNKEDLTKHINKIETTLFITFIIFSFLFQIIVLQRLLRCI